MRNWLMRFMAGRNGADQFARFLSIAALVILILSMFLPGYVGTACWVIALFCLVYSYFRMFSKSITKRYAENQKYLQMTAGIRRKWASFQRDMKDRKTHHIYKCPGCKQKIRVPRGKGKIAIRCPKCHTEFIKKS